MVTEGLPPPRGMPDSLSCCGDGASLPALAPSIAAPKPWPPRRSQGSPPHPEGRRRLQLSGQSQEGSGGRGQRGEQVSRKEEGPG